MEYRIEFLNGESQEEQNKHNANLKLMVDDDEYYRGVGKEYESCSKVGTLLKNPKEYADGLEETLPMVVGRYFHLFMLEPEKCEDVLRSTMASRNSKAYKAELELAQELDPSVKYIILEKEIKECEEWGKAMKANMQFHDLIYSEDTAKEVAGIAFLHGRWWKAKADLWNDAICDDLKTSGDIMAFHWNAKKYNYDVRAYIYRKIFKVPHRFLVVDKKTMLLGIYTPDESFYESGRDKVIKAMEVHDKFYGEEATEDVDNFFIEMDLFS